MHATCPVHPILLDLNTLKIFCEPYKLCSYFDKTDTKYLSFWTLWASHVFLSGHLLLQIQTLIWNKLPDISEIR
jgi:hypothetical protein